MKDKNYETAEKELFVKKLVEEVKKDFEKRRTERKELERQWELNLNFYMGNQYCDISSHGELVEDQSDYYWQKRGVFNHVAPLVDMRMAKLLKVNPVLSVRPSNEDDAEIVNAKLGEKLLKSFFRRNDVQNVIKHATAWSEICGTVFYKMIWDNDAGTKIAKNDGEDVYEGDVKMVTIPPFEIFPDNLFAEDVKDLKSIIHARAMKVGDILDKYGVLVDGTDVDVFSLAPVSTVRINDKFKNVEHNSAVVIEKYEMPTKEHKNGRFIVVAGDKLLYYGELPYSNGEDGRRSLPFVRQSSLEVAGSFFGSSIVERLIPLQKSYNALKNRKHEFLNRLTMGVMTVEDGSIDVDDLVDEGLSPGKVLVYRQGCTAPKMMDESVLPQGFEQEEVRLLQEFSVISGVNDIATSTNFATVTSGTALELLIEQCNEKLTVTAENIRKCYLELSKHALRLYRQFVRGVKAIKELDQDSQVKIFYVDSHALTSDDVMIDSQNELLFTQTQKKDVVFKVFESGLLNDEGKITADVKEKVLELLGYKQLASSKGIIGLHEQKAESENKLLRRNKMETEIIDDDKIHFDEHTRYMLAEYEKLSKIEKDNLLYHIKLHKENMQNVKAKGEE